MTFEYHYRRRYLDGATGISAMTVPALERPANGARVLDYRVLDTWNIGPVSGRRGRDAATIQRLQAVAARLWLWPGRPMRLVQNFDQRGACVLYRIDFATPLRVSAGACYQTDLYLDMFISPTTDEYVVADEDELEQAHSLGLISRELLASVQGQAAELERLLEGGSFTTWLALVCPVPFDLAAAPDGRVHTHREFAPGEPDGWPAE